MSKIAVLVSGGGSNLQAIIDNIQSKSCSYKIEIVLADRQCSGIERAKKNGIETKVIDRKLYKKKISDEINKTLENRDIALIVLAGFLSILDENFVNNWQRKIINIHPSLLPKFGGVGMYGIKVHQSVIEAKEKESGCTVHYVETGVDTGETIAQLKVPVYENDTPEMLQKRVLEKEHLLFPMAIEKIIKKELQMKRALISVYDKTGIIEFSSFLHKNGYEIISTGGTYSHLKRNNIPVREISEITDFPEMLNGRVKTLHPAVHGGILAKRDNEEHMNTIKQHDIFPIDIVVVNLYPFLGKAKENIIFEEKMEFIDIGGPTMLRSAAKSFKDVLVICDVEDYSEIEKEIANNKINFSLRKKLAGKVFNLTSAYDAAISNFLLEEKFPKYLNIPYEKTMELKYGENPHQKAAYYTSVVENGAMKNFEQLNGKELSFNNLRDMDLAWKVVSEFQEIACCSVKHSTPCGAALGKDAFEAYLNTYEGDPISIFGGIVAFNTTVDEKTAKKLTKIFLEIVVAPDYTDEAIKELQNKKNLRVIKCKFKPQDNYNYVQIDGGILIQEEDRSFCTNYDIVTNKKPTNDEIEDLTFAMKIVKYAKSNAIVVAKNKMILGIGNGETNRIWATNQAIERAGARVKGAVLASDAFFPFKDVVESCGKAGISAIIQPGGSIRDEESINACNENNISMIFTRMRHFKH